MEVPTPLLLIVPHDEVLLHEEYDEGRADRLAATIVKDGLLKDPPIVGRLPNIDKLIELDGTNRLVALRRMGLDCALVQVVDYLDPSLRLSSWYHIVHGRNLGELLAAVQDTPGVSMARVTREEADKELTQRTIIGYFAPSGEPNAAYCLSVETDLPGQARALNAIVHLYKHAGGSPVRRISSEEADGWPRHIPIGESNQDGIMIAFPVYTPHEVAEMALSGNLLPSGVTRHLLPVRALGISLPLEVLTKPATLAERNAALEQLIAARARAGRIRFYHEPTFVYDD